jgi:hypothetical protein
MKLDNSAYRAWIYRLAKDDVYVSRVVGVEEGAVHEKRKQT